MNAPPTLPPRTSDAVPVVNGTALQAFSLPHQLRPPRDSLTVVVKGTFALVQGAPAALHEAQDPLSGDVRDGDPPGGELLYPTDFAPFKPAADVLLAGSAYPRRAGDTSTMVTLRLGRALRHGVAVLGPRRWRTSGMGAPEPFERVPLRWSNAFGGPGFARNLAGQGHRASASDPTRNALPQLERPGALITAPSDTPAPAGFGPIAPEWSPRAEKLGTYDARWLATRWPYFPDDYDWSYQNAAPAELQVPYLRGDEDYELAGVRPGAAVLYGALPGVRPRVFAQRTAAAGDGFEEVRLVIDTAHFDADAGKLVLLWRGVLEVSDEDAPELAMLYVDAESGDEVRAPEDYLARFHAALAARGVLPLDDPGTTDDAQPPPAPAPPTRAAALALLARGDLSGADLSGADLRHLDLAGRDLHGAIFTGADFTGANLSGANLAEATLAGARLTGANLTRADLTTADLTGADLTRADLTGAQLDHAVLSEARADDARFTDARATRADFTAAHLARANFEGAHLASAEFVRCAMERACFARAVLDDARFREAHGAEVDLRGASLVDFRAEAARLPRSAFDRAHAPGSVWYRAELTGSSLVGVVLTGAILTRAVLEGADLSGVDAVEAMLRRTRLRGAKLTRANLMKSTLHAADLTEADLRGANLHQVETWKTVLDRADWTLAIVTGTRLAPR